MPALFNITLGYILLCRKVTLSYNITHDYNISYYYYFIAYDLYNKIAASGKCIFLFTNG